MFFLIFFEWPLLKSVAQRIIYGLDIPFAGLDCNLSIKTDQISIDYNILLLQSVQRLFLNILKRFLFVF